MLIESTAERLKEDWEEMRVEEESKWMKRLNSMQQQTGGKGQNTRI